MYQRLARCTVVFAEVGLSWAIIGNVRENVAIFKRMMPPTNRSAHQMASTFRPQDAKMGKLEKPNNLNAGKICKALRFRLH